MKKTFAAFAAVATIAGSLMSVAPAARQKMAGSPQALPAV